MRPKRSTYGNHISGLMIITIYWDFTVWNGQKQNHLQRFFKLSAIFAASIQQWHPSAESSSMVVFYS